MLIVTKGRILRRKLEEAEATKAQLHAEVSVVRSRKEEAEVERHRLVLAQQNEAAGAHAQVCHKKERDREGEKGSTRYFVSFPSFFFFWFGCFCLFLPLCLSLPAFSLSDIFLPLSMHG